MLQGLGNVINRPLVLVQGVLLQREGPLLGARQLLHRGTGGELCSKGGKRDWTKHMDKLPKCNHSQLTLNVFLHVAFYIILLCLTRKVMKIYKDLSPVYIFLNLTQGSPLISITVQCSKEFRICQKAVKNFSRFRSEWKVRKKCHKM